MSSYYALGKTCFGMQRIASQSLLWVAYLISAGSCAVFQPKWEATSWQMKAEESVFTGQLTFWNDFEVLYEIEEVGSVFLGYYRAHQDTVFVEIDRSLGENHQEILLDSPMKWVLFRNSKQLTLEACYIQNANTLEWKEEDLENKKHFYLLTSN